MLWTTGIVGKSWWKLVKKRVKSKKNFFRFFLNFKNPVLWLIEVFNQYKNQQIQFQNKYNLTEHWLNRKLTAKKLECSRSDWWHSILHDHSKYVMNYTMDDQFLNFQVNFAHTLPRSREENGFVESMQRLRMEKKFMLMGASKDRTDMHLNLFFENMDQKYCRERYFRYLSYF